MSSDLYFNEFHPTIYLNVLRTSALLSTCAFIVATYLIVFQTPRRFGNYKWFMLNISISAYIFDIYTSLIYAPLPLFPILYACGLGPVRFLGQQIGGVYSYDLFIILFGVTNISIIVAIAFRYAILKNYAKYFCSKLGIAVIATIELTAALPIVFSRHIAIGDPVANRNKVVEIYPYAKHVLENEYCTGVSIEFSPVKTWVFMVNTFLGFFCAVPIALYLITKSFAMLNDFTSKMSPMTRRLHKQLLYSLFCQFAVPFTTLIIPFVVLVIVASLRINTSSHYAQYIVFFGTFHSVGNTLMLIATIKPYRNILLSVMGKRVEPISWLHTTKQSGIVANVSNVSQIS